MADIEHHDITPETDTEWAQATNETLHMFHMIRELGWAGEHAIPLRERRYAPATYGQIPTPGHEQPRIPLNSLLDELYYVADVYRYGLGRADHEFVAEFDGPTQDIDNAFARLVDDDQDVGNVRFWYDSAMLQGIGHIGMFRTTQGNDVLTPEEFLRYLFTFFPHLSNVLPRMYRFQTERALRHSNFEAVQNLLILGGVALPMGITYPELLTEPWLIATALGMHEMHTLEFWLQDEATVINAVMNAVYLIQAGEAQLPPPATDLA